MSHSDDDETFPLRSEESVPDAEHWTGLDVGETVTSASSDSASSRATKYIGRYKLISELGQGGQGAVYLAEDERIRRKVALKVLFAGLAHSTEARLRFEREAEATARLNHPGIAKIHEFGETDGAPFIAMELVEGQTLAARLSAARQAPREEDLYSVHFDNSSQKTGTETSPNSSTASTVLSSDQKPLLGAARFLESAARALHVAHEAGLVHRDIKPGNIMVRPDESPCILDFGLAHDESAQGITLTRSNDRFGTPTYMAPEQVRRDTREIDRRTDVWALGAVLYECCTLKRPFEAPSPDELFERIKNDEPRSPRSVNPKIPKDLEAVILTALDKDPSRRYATAEDMAEDLRRFRRNEPVQARPAGRLLKTLRWVQRNRLVAAGSSIVMLALLTAAIVFYVKGDEARLAQQRAELALAAETRARQEKDAALDDYDRLADVKRLEAAVAASDELYPPSPALIPELENWQREHGAIAERLEDHRAFLTELRLKAMHYGGEEKKRDFAIELAEIRRTQTALSEIETAIANGVEDAATTASRLEQQAALYTRLAELNTLITIERRSWLFENQAVQFQHDVLEALVADIESFATSELGPVQSVGRRLEQSRVIARATLESDVASRWAACRKRIAANPKYADLDLRPQLGLIPLGSDPDSGLEEFLHWLTHEGDVPERDANGRLTVTEDLGVVLVLIPGGNFLMGSQAGDPALPNFDTNANLDEQPVNEVRLASYLLSKYEMTQAQWQRAYRANPSQYMAGFNSPAFKAPVDARHPVERISWNDAQLLLSRIDLGLPTEAEWERAAQAGRSYQVYAGTSDLEALRKYANIAGSETESVGFPTRQAGHEDDNVIHAPVGSYRPNDYGLHDMTGNVWEWCLDGLNDSYAEPPGARGLRPNSGTSDFLVARGGSFDSDAVYARIASRFSSPPDIRHDGLGIRPVRLIP